MLKLNVINFDSQESFMEVNLDYVEFTSLRQLMWDLEYMWYSKYTDLLGEQRYGLVTTLPLFSEALVKEPVTIKPEQLLGVKEQ